MLPKIKQYLTVCLVVLVTGSSVSSNSSFDIQVGQAAKFASYMDSAYIKVWKFVNTAANMLISANFHGEPEAQDTEAHEPVQRTWIDMSRPQMAPELIGRLDIHGLLNANCSELARDKQPDFVVALMRGLSRDNAFYLFVPQNHTERIQSIFREQIVDSCDRYLLGMDTKVYSVGQGPRQEFLPSEEQLSTLFGFYLGESVYRMCEKILWHRATILDNLEEAYRRAGLFKISQ